MSTISISYNNIALTKLTAVFQEHSDIAKTISDWAKNRSSQTIQTGNIKLTVGTKMI